MWLELAGLRFLNATVSNQIGKSLVFWIDFLSRIACLSLEFIYFHFGAYWTANA